MNKFKLLLIPFFLISFSHAVELKDGDWTKLDGIVTDAYPDYFILNEGDKKTIVEMDDSDWYKEGAKILKGDNVVVHGRVDHDFLEKRKIEASSVFVKGIDTYFFASSEDDEPDPFIRSFYYEVKDLPDGLMVEFSGNIEAVDGREFVLNTGLQRINVDTADMNYDPLDNFGFPALKTGDKIKVYGRVDDSLFSEKEIDASYIITLKQ